MPNSLYSDLCDVYDEGKKPYLFISYSHEDTTRVVAAIRALQRMGYRIWYDMGISAGAQWPEDVADHIFCCDAVLAFMTPNSILSDNCREELFYAKKCSKKILLAYLDKCDLTHGMDMRLGMLQAIERWRCKDDEEFYTRLAKEKILQPCRGEIESSDSSIVPDTDAIATDTEQKQFQINADQGDIIAQYNLGIHYQYGPDVAHDLKEAVKYYRLAAEQNYPPALRALGLCYEYGNGVEKDPVEAVRLYQIAADLNHPDSINSLGWCYETGIGTEKDMDKAVSLYTQAAQLGEPYAQQNLALCYEYSKGVAQDWDAAAYWYRRSAENGVPYAQYKMAECYRKGLGVPIDLEESARWQNLYDENPNK
jgi:hypothetical protein